MILQFLCLGVSAWEAPLPDSQSRALQACITKLELGNKNKKED